ncbi:Sec-independent protein translocase protein TatB [Marinomonas sp. 2405UD68-3]|uniref:Sec-independent protein translocase protein TatB n=1 Tax=Marinomonas sp. 2405UD68-3 TaxID=3391835 RepID=UPI0039C8CAB6
MFDIGFSELLIVFIVGLLILGPERLPHAAKTAGLWIRKIKRSIGSVQREINEQLDQEELQQKILETNNRIMAESNAIQNTITPLPENPDEKEKYQEKQEFKTHEPADTPLDTNTEAAIPSQLSDETKVAQTEKT